MAHTPPTPTTTTTHHHQHCHGFQVLEQPQGPQAGFHHVHSPFHSLLHQGFLPYGFAAAAAAAPASAALVEELIKLSPPGSPPPPPEAGRYGLLAMLEQKTDQLQALVHSMSHTGILQPQAAMAAARMASSISQLALATLGVQVQPPSPTPPPAAFFLQEQPPPPPPPHIAMGSALGLFHQLSAGCVQLTATPAPQQLPPQQPPQQAPQQPRSQSPPPAVRSPLPSSTERESLPGAEEEAEAEAAPLVEEGGDACREEEEEVEGEELTPGSYDLVEMNAVEILAEHTHFCDKCGKGFKRDANLRMHMRGHGEQYKSPAALAKPAAEAAGASGSETRPRRYSCPYLGCKRNKRHRKFQPLKTVLCVKNHYRRSHCPKSLTCAKCKSKKFSVVADLKTHEKHCGREKWQCSCGTTFSRKDKLLGHIGLFQGHTPAQPLEQRPLLAAVAAAAAAAAAAGGGSGSTSTSGSGDGPATTGM